MAYYRNIYEDQNVYLDGERLRGVQSFDANFEIPYDPIKVAGIGFVGHTINSNLEGAFNVGRFVVSNHDPISGMFVTPFSGHLRYGTGNNSLALSFNNAYINSYNSSCSIGAIPSIDFGANVYGDMGSFVPTASEQVNIDNILIARPGDIILTNVSGERTNRVQSYNYDISINRTPIYTLGSGLEPGLFNIDYPIEINLDFNMHIDDFQTQDMHDLLCDQPKDNISIILSGCNTDNYIRKFIAPDPLFLGIDQNGAVGDQASIDIKYKSYINDIRELQYLIGGGIINVLLDDNDNGTIEYDGSPITTPTNIEVDYGERITITISPDAGYTTTDIQINGESFAGEIDPGSFAFTTPPIKFGTEILVTFTAAVTTAAPTTSAPTTSAPTTSAPTTSAPTTSAPTTSAPTTSAPTTSAPTTAAPTTSAPTTSAPTTSAPTTAAPTTSAPTTAAPTTPAPTTAAPTTPAPTTAAPTTSAPTTAAPTTSAPTTPTPTTPTPTTPTPTTPTPTTPTPTTPTPTTPTPTTSAPTTSAPAPCAPCDECVLDDDLPTVVFVTVTGDADHPDTFARSFQTGSGWASNNCVYNDPTMIGLQEGWTSNISGEIYFDQTWQLQGMFYTGDADWSYFTKDVTLSQGDDCWPTGIYTGTNAGNVTYATVTECIDCGVPTGYVECNCACEASSFDGTMIYSREITFTSDAGDLTLYYALDDDDLTSCCKWTGGYYDSEDDRDWEIELTTSDQYGTCTNGAWQIYVASFDPSTIESYATACCDDSQSTPGYINIESPFDYCCCPQGIEFQFDDESYETPFGPNCSFDMGVELEDECGTADTTPTGMGALCDLRVNNEGGQQRLTPTTAAPTTAAPTTAAP